MTSPPPPATTDWVPIWNLNAPAMPPSGMVPIFDQVLTGPQANIDITNIPQTFAHLYLVWDLKGNGSTWVQLLLKCNNDAGASQHVLRGGQVDAYAPQWNLCAIGGTIDGVSSGSGFATIENYTQSVMYAGIHGMGSARVALTGTISTDITINAFHGHYGASTPTPITRLTLTPSSGSWVAGSRVTLYGIPAKPVATQTQVSLNSNYVPIADVLLGSAQATIDFTSIPQNYSHLKIVGQGRGDSSGGQMFMKINGDATAADYSIGLRHWTEGTTSHADSIAATVNGCAILGDFTTSADPAGRTTAFEIDVPDYTNSLFTKAFFAHLINSAATREMFCSGWWTGLTPVSRITLTLNAGNFLAGTHFTLYGISTTPVVSASNVITAPTVATTLPASPVDQQQAILVDNTSSPTYAWTFQWSALASKWIAIGPTPLRGVDLTNTARALNVTTYTAFTGAPAITLPRAGLYVVQCGGFGGIQTGSGGGQSWLGYSVGATAPADQDAMQIYDAIAGNILLNGSSTPSPKTVAAPGTVIQVQGKHNGSSSTVYNPWVQATPVWVT